MTEKKYNNKPLKQFQKIAASVGFEVLLEGDSGYDNYRKNNNLRFNYSPRAIALPQKAGHVSMCVKYCQDPTNAIKLRIRSGGHHHEGMCAANGVMLVRMTEINKIEVKEDQTQAWIGSGIPLKEVYSKLENEYKKTIPGGACQSVHVGGVTLGGGWGYSTRMFGMTCDNVIQAEVVLADGRVVYADKDHHPELFWAIRGGGGGNFGIVTRFLFALSELGINKYVTKLEMNFEKSKMEEVITKWLEKNADFTPALTTALFVSIPREEKNNMPLALHGQYYGSIENLETEIKAFSDLASTYNYTQVEVATGEKRIELYPAWLEKTPETSSKSSIQAMMANAYPSLEVPASASDGRRLAGAPKISTCEGFHANKITSTFPRKNCDPKQLANAIYNYCTNRKAFEKAVTFIGLHALGGRVNAKPLDANAFPFRDKKFVMKIQTWWNDPKDSESDDYIGWATDLRKELLPYSEGAFINFIDREVEPLADYYGGHLEPEQRKQRKQRIKRLQTTKKTYDPDNLFDFEMGIMHA